jgi:hypothetical protein
VGGAKAVQYDFVKYFRQKFSTRTLA